MVRLSCLLDVDHAGGGVGAAEREQHRDVDANGGPARVRRGGDVEGVEQLGAS